MPSSQWRMLADPPISILDTLMAIDDAIDDNADLAEDILRLGLTSFGLAEQPSSESSLNWHGKARLNDLPKAHSTIRQFYRDWSREGYKAEVEPLVKIIMADLIDLLPLDARNLASSSPSILLPGAGLGRLLFELCIRGYNTTGNEISYHQLLASNFILNSTQQADQYSIYPFATTFTNVTSRQNQLKHITVPDIHPGSALVARADSGGMIGEMNMTAGDFVLSYSNPDTKETFDGVVSVFFIDTAPNLIRYIETIRNCLKQGGVWINIGPLLWHFDGRQHSSNDMDEGQAGHGVDSSRSPEAVSNGMEDKGIGEPGSFELTDEEVLQLIPQFGFEILKHENIDRASGTDEGFGYMQDPSSLLQSRYRCIHWVARKL
jgi:carnosine N-methyltransferase